MGNAAQQLIGPSQRPIKVECQGLREYDSPNFKANYLCLVSNLSEMQGLHLQEWLTLRLRSDLPSLPINPDMHSEDYSKAHASIAFDRQMGTLAIYVDRREEGDRRIYDAAAMCEAELAELKSDSEGFLKRIGIITVLRRTAMEESLEKPGLSSENGSTSALLSLFSFGYMGPMVFKEKR